jgi:glycosyltransferase involved in cell wall biosynthesis
VTPFFATVELSPHYDELVAKARAPEPFVFSGGDTLRDYGLLRAALGGTDVRVRVATRRTAGPWPSNFEVGPVSATEFHEAMAASSAVVMALDASTPRSTGQQSYLNAMRLGKPTIVNDAAGVRELVDGGAFVVGPRDAAALRERVEWVLANPDSPELRAVVERGISRTTHEVTMEAYYLRILELARGL